MEKDKVIMAEVDTGNIYEDNHVGENLLDNEAVLVNPIIGKSDGGNLLRRNTFMKEWNLMSSEDNGNVMAPIEDDRWTEELVA